MAEFLAGFNAKATIDSAAYAFATYRVRAVGQHHDVSNTEGLAGNSGIPAAQLGDVSGASGAAVFQSNLPGQLHLEATVRQATFDLANNPFAAPIVLDVGFFYEIAILYVTAGPAWEADSFLINDLSGEGDVKGLQPVSFSGVSDGKFFLPA